MENHLIINGLHSTANCGHKRALAVVVPPHVLPTRFTISTISRQTVKTRISCSLKRFPRTTGQKTVTTCAENVLARTLKLVVPDFSMSKQAPAGVMPLEVRFAHPVRLSPDTHSQGHGRPCPQRHHPRRGFSATWTFHDCSFQMGIP